MTVKIVNSLIILVVCAASSTTLGGGIVNIKKTFDDDSTELLMFSDSASILFSVESTVDAVNIWHDSDTNDIPHVTITGTGSNPLGVIIGESAPAGAGVEPFDTACNDFGGLISTTRDSRLYGRISGNLTGDILVTRITWFRVDGLVNAKIKNQLDNSSFNRLTLGGISSSGSIHYVDGVPRRLDISGDVDGDINGDGVVDTADLGILLSQFDETCGAESLGGGGEGSVGSMLEDMGFDNLAEYTEWLDGLTTQECIEHLCEMMEILTEE
jgi:hypothetical protein